ncbi:MAG: EFR1 family ferrodoxin [Firmicutes bacterium]|nr:EFR1 family ferrodoxin [Bacillota bacterium]
MKLKLYYFTGTGNSLVVARNIGNEFAHAELISMTNLMCMDKEIVIAGDIVRFVFPVYFARPPAFIKEFIQQTNFGDISYIFAVVNGGGLFGRTLHLFNELLQQKDIRLDAGFLIGMPGNHPKVASMQRKGPEAYYAAAAVKTKAIAQLVKAKQPGKLESNWGLLGHVIALTAFQKPYQLSKAKKLDSAYWVNDNCVQCGNCERICPMQNITDSQTKPRWHHNCINCAACYHYCSAKAICLDKEDPSFRYNHPDVTATDLIIYNN